MASPATLRLGIEALHRAIAEHQDPEAKQTLTACLQQLMKVQALDYQRLAQTVGPERAAVLNVLSRPY